MYLLYIYPSTVLKSLLTLSYCSSFLLIPVENIFCWNIFDILHKADLLPCQPGSPFLLCLACVVDSFLKFLKPSLVFSLLLCGHV